MITTGQELTTFITGLNGGASIDATLLDTLVSTAKSILEGERPWMVLRKVDTSKSVTTAGTWQTAIDLSTITDFSEFYGDCPVVLFDGTTLTSYYRLVPWDERLAYKDASDTCVYDASNKNLYLNGTPAFAGTPYIYYKATSTEVDLTLASAVWTKFPARFLPLLGYLAREIHAGAIDYDDVTKNMLPAHRAVYTLLKGAMENWDSALQLSAIEHTDPTGGGRDYPMGARVNRNG